MRARAVSVFSGAGGVDHGLIAAGYHLLASADFDRDCCETLRNANIGPVYKIDLLAHNAKEVCSTFGVAPGDVDLLIGGPPCQPYSKSSFWTDPNRRGLADPRSGTLSWFLEFVSFLRPKAFVLENVPGITRHQLHIEDLLMRFARENGVSYHTQWIEMNAADYGVPQSRRRAFFIGFIAKNDFRAPLPTHGAGRIPYVSAWESINTIKVSRYDEDLTIKGKWSDLVPTIPEGGNYLHHTNRGNGVELFGWRTRYWSFLLKMDKTQPAPTITANPAQNTGPYHWDNRLLSTEELAALQTFPAGVFFSGDRASRHRQIGNAVPSLLIEVLTRQIAHSLGFHVKGKLQLEVDRTKCAPPPPEPTKPVPKKYKELIGTKKPHPGTGKGPGAQKIRLATIER